MQCIYFVFWLRRILADQLESPTVVFMTPEVTSAFGFVTWQVMRNSDIIPQVVPPTIFSWFKSSNKGVFEHIQMYWIHARDLRSV